MLKDSELKLKELNASKDKFFSIIAHDLRNPFGAVLGFAEILYREAKELSSDEIIEYSSYILQQSRTIYDLLENLLSWSRIQTGRIEFKPEPLPLFDCVNEIVTINQSVALKKQIELAYDCAPDLNIFADRNMLLTVLRNLTSNAMKFTEPGGSVKIRATSPNDEIRISVRDSGIGMSSEDIQKLFKIDTHHSTIGTNEEKGSGLGLVLCKEFIEKHNGRIWVESQPGAGSEFIFTIPKR
jgi:signal transduction histidine kinase